MSTAVSKNAGTAPVGVTPQPMPSLNGTLQQNQGEPQIYLVLNSLLCWVPDTTTLGNLFLPNAKINPNADEVSAGTPLTSGAVLAQADGTSPCYLVTDGQKMWIPNSDIFNAYQFNSKNIQFVAPIILDSIPTGPDVEGPTS